MLATGRKGVQQGGETKTKLEQPEDPGKRRRKRQQEKVDEASKPPRPGYRGPTKEMQEGPGKSPKRWEETREEGSTEGPPPKPESK